MDGMASKTELEYILDFLREAEWSYEINDAHDRVAFGVTLENGKADCLIVIRQELSLVNFYSSLRVNVMPPDRPRTSELLMRANFGLKYGNFEMDYDDGELRYKTSLIFPDGALTEEGVRRLVLINLMTMNRYLPAIMSVAFGGKDPSAALRALDSNDLFPYNGQN